jgi:hypothetical protein
MLTQDYASTLFNVFMAGLPSVPGILTILLLVCTIISPRLIKASKPRLRAYAFRSSLLLLLILATTTLYTATFEYDEQPETLDLQVGERTCNSGWSGWTKAGYGTGNPCPKGCYRGVTLRKQLSMSGFPPWPNYRRELQCLTNED